MAVISISRQFGAGGKTLGERVAKRMGYRFIYDDILQQVATEANVSVQWVEGVEKEAGDRLMRFLTTLVPSNFIERHLGDDKTALDEKKLAVFLTKVIERIAENDDAVILGRGGQFVLKDHENTVRVLLVSERADRIQFIVDHYGLGPAKAEQAVTREERKRQRFVSNFYSGDPDDPSLYHLAINTSLMNLDEAEELICGLVGDFISGKAKPIW